VISRVGSSRDTGIEEDAYPWTAGRLRGYRLREERRLRQFQNGYSVLAGDTGEIAEERFERVAGFQIIGSP
jgi:hypothetical protein